MKLVWNQMFMMTVVTGIVGMGFGFMVMIFTLQLTLQQVNSLSCDRSSRYVLCDLSAVD